MASLNFFGGGASPLALSVCSRGGEGRVYFLTSYTLPATNQIELWKLSQIKRSDVPRTPDIEGNEASQGA